jgi:hypothetical protein
MGDTVLEHYKSTHADSVFVPIPPSVRGFYRNGIDDIVGPKSAAPVSNDGKARRNILDRGVFVEFSGIGPDRQISRMVFYTYHPQFFSMESWPVISGVPRTSPEKMRMLAMERMIDVCMALSLGRVSEHSMQCDTNHCGCHRSTEFAMPPTKRIQTTVPNQVLSESHLPCTPALFGWKTAVWVKDRTCRSTTIACFCIIIHQQDSMYKVPLLQAS